MESLVSATGSGRTFDLRIAAIRVQIRRLDEDRPPIASRSAHFCTDLVNMQIHGPQAAPFRVFRVRVNRPGRRTAKFRGIGAGDATPSVHWRPFACERFIRSLPTQKVKCRASQDLSIGTKYVDTRPITKPQFLLKPPAWFNSIKTK